MDAMNDRTNPRGTPARWLDAAALGAALVALLHLAIIFAEPSAYAYFGAPEFSVLKAAGSPLPDAVTVGLVLVFGGFAAYALSGAGRVRRLPLLEAALLAVGAVFTLRGLALFYELAMLARGEPGIPPRHALFSLVALLIGVSYLAGALPLWRSRRARPLGRDAAAEPARVRGV